MLFTEGEKLKQYEKLSKIEKEIAAKREVLQRLAEDHENTKRNLSVLQIEHVVETRILERMNGAKDVDEAKVGDLQEQPRAE